MNDQGTRKPLEQRARISAEQVQRLVFVLQHETVREFLTDLVYDVCGVQLPTYDATVKEGRAQENLLIFLAGMAQVGHDLEATFWGVAPELWETALNERTARVRMAMTQGDHNEASRQEESR